MRRITLLLAAILTVCSLNAQKGNKNEKVVNIDKVNYRITYNGKMVPDTTRVPYNYWESEMRLDIGSKTTHFYDRTKQISDSIMDEQARTGQHDMSKIPNGGRIRWEFYKNYPSKGQTTLLDKVLGNYYQCTEKIEVPNWQLTPDSTTTIIGYKCLLAKALFKGRTWYAWYSEDIPISEGPWKISGLPGLVLLAYDQNKQYIFNAIGMSTLNGTESITFTEKAREKVTQKELREAKHKFDGAEALKATARKTGFTFKKLPEGAIKALNRSNKGNPIELE